MLKAVVIAQITDLHIKRRGHVLHHMPHTAGPLRQTLATLESLPEKPSLIVATGDLTELGRRDEYERLRGILSQTNIPVYLVPGNHDNRAKLRAIFDDHAYLQGDEMHIQYVVEHARWRLIALDSVDPTRSAGAFDKRRLRWFADRLQERPNTPTIVALHHPPFPTGVAPVDQAPFPGRHVFGSIVRENPQIARVICGHIHRPMQLEWNGTIACSAPSTAPNFVLDKSFGVTWEPGGYLLHRIAGSSVITELRRLDGASQSLSA